MAWGGVAARRQQVRSGDGEGGLTGGDNIGCRRGRGREKREKEKARENSDGESNKGEKRGLQPSWGMRSA